MRVGEDSQLKFITATGLACFHLLSGVSLANAASDEDYDSILIDQRIYCKSERGQFLDGICHYDVAVNPDPIENIVYIRENATQDGSVWWRLGVRLANIATFFTDNTVIPDPSQDANFQSKE